MIAAIQGKLVALDDEAALVQVGGFEYEVLVCETVRRRLQNRVGSTVKLRTVYYLEGNATGGRLVPRLVGFLDPVEVKFFEQLSSVSGLGPRRALNMMRWPVSQLATAIRNRDVDLLSSLPGVGKATAEKIVAALRRHMEPFLTALEGVEEPEVAGLPRKDVEAAFRALLQLGFNDSEARDTIQRALSSGKTYTSLDELLRDALALYGSTGTGGVRR